VWRIEFLEYEVLKDNAGNAILIVDDEALEAELITRGFRKAGFENPVRVATGSEEAKAYLCAEGPYGDREKFPRPRLVILDHRMAGASGWEVLKWMRRDESFKEIAVVVFSGSDDPQLEAEALELGANAYHKKPQSSEDYDGILKRLGEFWLLGPGLG
jgi:CheY-like chemotaxis protein